MNTRRTPTRKVEDEMVNEGVFPKVLKVTKFLKGHKMRDFPTLSAKRGETKQASLDGPDPNAPKRNHFYMLQANKDKGAHLDEGTGK
uniref:Uncharacterized protein n=1 Tax=Solanum tuberosum TaxID=4113 RepID=M1E141_SOLTU